MSLLCSSEGCQIDAVGIPPFSLRSGNWIVLRWPIYYGSKAEDKLYSMLRDRTSSEFANFSVVGITIPIESWIKSKEIPPRSIGQLLANLPREDQSLLMTNLRDSRLSANSALNEMPGTIQRLAEVMLASLSVGFIVFNIAGLDPMGTQKIYEYVFDKSRKGLGVLELVFPSVGSHRKQHPADVEILECHLLRGP